MDDTSDTGLSPEQEEVVREAVESGYFEVPRRTSLVELSDRLDMTDAETSAKLRRALDQHLRATLLDDESS